MKPRDLASKPLPRMRKRLKDDDLLGLLRLIVKGDRSGKHAAKMLGVSPQFLCDVLAERRPITDRLGSALGFKRVCHWEARR